MKQTVEIISDLTSAPENVDLALEGIELILACTSALEIVCTSRVFRLSRRLGNVFDKKHYNLPLGTATNTVLLTTQQIIEGNQHLMGEASIRPNNPGGVAVVDVTDPNSIATTTAHELGHLLRVKVNDPSRHCPDSNCLMYTSIEEELLYANTPRILGFYQQDFCSGCADELHAL